jgi:hypothetical protein
MWLVGLTVCEVPSCCIYERVLVEYGGLEAIRLLVCVRAALAGRFSLFDLLDCLVAAERDDGDLECYASSDHEVWAG